MRSHRKIQIHISPVMWLLIPVLILWIPIWWLIAWCIAAGLHELSHIMMLKACHSYVYGIEIGLSGTLIKTEPLCLKTEVLAATAGPMFSIVLISLGRWIPRIAICALFQTIYNLIPFENRDGGRILRCLLNFRFSREIADQVFSIIQVICIILVIVAVTLAGLYTSHILFAYILLSITLRLIVTIKRPCKQKTEIVQ